MTKLQALSEAAWEASLDAMAEGEFQRSARLRRIATSIDRELDVTAHHPNCECNRCFDQMGENA